CRLSATVGAIVKAFENFIAVIAPVVLAFALMDPFSICGKAEFNAVTVSCTLLAVPSALVNVTLPAVVLGLTSF
ncbi:MULTISPECIES: hypothetical protein, partial [Blautia]|uniref:hypothetical protein n=1 Tax=Blautia TaxID=572511 RepID=UPI00197AEB0D